MLVNTYQATWYHNSEDHNIGLQHYMYETLYAINSDRNVLPGINHKVEEEPSLCLLHTILRVFCMEVELKLWKME
jgi:hypothetical protein